MMAMAVYVLLLVGSMLTLSNGDCAPDEAIYPCVCEWKINVKCGHMTPAQLKAAITAQKNHSGGEFRGKIHLTDYRMSYIPPGLLSGLGLSNLEVNTSALQSFYDPLTKQSAFLGAEDSITTLTVNYYGRRIENFDWASLSPLSNLYGLYLSGSFSAIADPLPPLPNVINFWLQDSDVSYITKNAFAGMTAVVDLRVRENAMPTYRRNIFPRPALNLSVFITRDDDITTLPDDYFDGMPTLQYVDIPSFLHTIPPLNVHGPTNLQGSRGLTCDSRLKWLLRMRDEGKVNILHAICARPQHLYWRDVDSLSEKDL